MKTAVSTAALAATALAASVPRQAQQDIDSTVLNFALTLEHLEDNFYSGALKQFSAADFKAAGAPDSFYTDLQYIASDEATHVKELTSALQAAKIQAAAACTYNFPYSDAKGFLGLATILEGVGTSAYLGAAPLITSKGYLTAAGSILVSEALHTSLLRSTTGLIPNANPNGTPIDPTTAYTLAAAFIKSCPSSNPALPFTAFPSASGPSSAVKGGSSVSISSTTDVPADSYLTFISGLSVISVKGQISGKSVSAAVPTAAGGQTYVLITKHDAAQDNSTLVDSNVVAGPAILEVTPQAPSSVNGTATGSSSPSGTGSSSGSGSGSIRPTGSSAPASTNVPYKGAASRMVTGGVALLASVAAAVLLL